MHGDKDEMKAKEFMKASKVLATNGSHDLFVRVGCACRLMFVQPKLLPLSHMRSNLPRVSRGCGGCQLQSYGFNSF